MRKKKIIFVHQIVYPYGPNFPAEFSDDFFHFGLGRLIIENIHEPVPYEFENWRADPGIDAPLERYVNGVKCRLFPARRSRKTGAVSVGLLKALKAECREHEVIIHTANTHSFKLILTALYLKKYPIITTHLGGPNPFYNFKKKRKIQSYFKYLLEKIALKNVDEFYVSVNAEKDYFTKIAGKEKINFGPVQGAEKTFVESVPLPRDEARKKLGIPAEKKVILTVGRLLKSKGADETLEVFKRLTKEYDVTWIAVGTSPTNVYYQQAKEAGVELLGYISRGDGLMDYFAAADVYSYPMYHDPETRAFGGTGIATLEALFYNLPYVGNGIAHIPGGEGANAGIIPNNREELYRGIKEVFDFPGRFGNTREIVKKYYTWGKVITRYLQTYRELFAEYYPPAA